MAIDYSFLHVGGLYEKAMEITIELCRRFGSDKAMSVYLEAVDHLQNRGETGFGLALIQECGVDPSAEDIAFLKKVVEALGSINYARKLFDEALKGAGRRSGELHGTK